MTDSIRSRVEALEARIAPSGLITVSFTNGALTLTGDGGDHDLSVSAIDATTFELRGVNETEFQLGSDAPTAVLRLIGPVKSISGAFGSGAQDIAFNNLTVGGNIELGLGGGANEVVFNSLSAKGGLKIFGGADNDQVVFSGSAITVKGGVDLNLSSGENEFEANAATVKIGKDFSMFAGEGEDHAIFNGVSFAIGGNAAFVLGDGAVEVSVSRFTVGKSLLVDNSDSAIAGLDTGLYLGSASGNSLGAVGAILVNGDVTYIGGATEDEFSVGTGGKSQIKGTARFTSEGGDARVGLFGLQLSIGRVEIDAALSSDLTVGGQFYGGRIAGGIQILGGAGADTFSMQAIGSNLGVLDIQLGDGENASSIGFVNSKAASISVSGGANRDEVSFTLISSQVKGNVYLQAGAGSSSTDFAGLEATVGGLVHVENGAHAGELVDLTFDSFGTHSGFLKVGGILFAPGDGGTSMLRLDGMRDLTVKGSIAIAGGTGNDTLSVQDMMNVRVGKGFDLAMGDGNNNVDGNIYNVTAGSLKLTGGSGSDFMELAVSGNLGVVTMELGAGENRPEIFGLDKPVAIKALSLVSGSLTGEADSLTLVGIQMSGALTARFGAGSSDVYIQDGFIGGVVDVQTGAGADLVRFDTEPSGSGLALAKPVLIDLGDDSDQLLLGGNGVSAFVTARSTFRAEAGGGLDTFTNPPSNVFKKTPEFIGFLE